MAGKWGRNQRTNKAAADVRAQITIKQTRIPNGSLIWFVFPSQKFHVGRDFNFVHGCLCSFWNTAWLIEGAPQISEE